MAAFELNDFNNPSYSGLGSGHKPNNADPALAGNIAQASSNTTKVENIISFKIYDCCRQQDCLDYGEIGPARAAESVTINGRTIMEGDVLPPPSGAASVTMDNVRIGRIAIVDKTPNSFRKGYWDIELKYVIDYRLVFRGNDANIITMVNCFSIFNRKLTMFGSEGTDLFVSTDLFGTSGMFQAMPFVLAEGKAMGLSASIIYDFCPMPIPGPGPITPPPGMRFDEGGAPVAVEVAIGLFSIVKLFRLVDLAVESRGFTIPEECEEVSPLNPCEYFDNLDFPMDLFAPPQRPEYLAGISSNIPASHSKCDHHHNHNHKCTCGCGCGCCNDDCCD